MFYNNMQLGRRRDPPSIRHILDGTKRLIYDLKEGEQNFKKQGRGPEGALLFLDTLSGIGDLEGGRGEPPGMVMDVGVFRTISRC